MNTSAKISRKDFLLGSTGVLATVGTIALAQGGSYKEGSHHEGSHGKSSKSQDDLKDAALNCVKAGQDCIQHCLEHFKKGDTSLADCAASVSEMVVFCTTLSGLSAFKSKRLAAFAKLCGQSCRDCEVECRKHEDTHPICKRCAEACAECSKHCQSA